MSSVDPFDDERQMVETILDILETLAVRLDTGELIQNAILGDVVDCLRELEDAAYDGGEGQPRPSRRVAQDETPRVLVDKIQWALESLGRGEAGAAGAFVLGAREYVRACRERMRVDGACFPTAAAVVSATVEGAPPGRKQDQPQRQRRVALPRFNRLVERYKQTQPPSASGMTLSSPGGCIKAN